MKIDSGRLKSLLQKKEKYIGEISKYGNTMNISQLMIYKQYSSIVEELNFVDTLYIFPKMRCCCMSKTEIVNTFDGLHFLPNLKHVICENVMIKKLPLELFNIKALKTLCINIQHTQNIHILKNIERLQHLETLYLFVSQHNILYGYLFNAPILKDLFIHVDKTKYSKKKKSYYSIFPSFERIDLPLLSTLSLHNVSHIDINVYLLLLLNHYSLNLHYYKVVINILFHVHYQN